MMDRLTTWLSMIFGYMFLALSVLVAAETILRKAFGFSLQGADELGGYALAVGSSLAFGIALLGRSHIRIELFHERMPVMVQALLNWLSIVSLAAFGGLLLWTGYVVVRDTMAYGSTSATPWMTPMVYPQGVWYASLGIFSILAAVLAIRASILFFSGRIEELNREFHPKGAMEELKEEIRDVEERGVAEAGSDHVGSASVPAK